MQTILQIIEQAGGYYSGLFLKIENPPYMDFDRREHPRETLDRMHPNDSMAKGLCPADVVQERLRRTLRSIAARATDRILPPQSVLVLVERTNRREDQMPSVWCPVEFQRIIKSVLRQPAGEALID